MTVLNASAVWALLHDEPGTVMLLQALTSARLGAASLAEVTGNLVDAEVDRAVFGAFSLPSEW